MICNWTAQYFRSLVAVSPSTGLEPGTFIHLTSDWNDQFDIVTVPRSIQHEDDPPFETEETIARAVDGEPFPLYLWDILPAIARAPDPPNAGIGTYTYQVDIGDRDGEQTARERWLIENPPLPPPAPGSTIILELEPAAMPIRIETVPVDVILTGFEPPPPSAEPFPVESDDAPTEIRPLDADGFFAG